MFWPWVYVQYTKTMMLYLYTTQRGLRKRLYFWYGTVSKTSASWVKIFAGEACKGNVGEDYRAQGSQMGSLNDFWVTQIVTKTNTKEKKKRVGDR
jgi:hypothetical protein